MGAIQADKSQSEIHKTTARIVKLAEKSNAGIALEDLKGIRKLYRKGNGQGTNFRARLNSWAFGEFQRQIEYKAKREGLTVIKDQREKHLSEVYGMWEQIDSRRVPNAEVLEVRSFHRPR